MEGQDGMRVRPRRLRLATTAAFAFAALSLAAATAQASKSDLPLPQFSYSPNWAGYVVTSPNNTPIVYSSVTGTWTVPKASCDKKQAGYFSTAWVGLGGYTPTAGKMENVGTDANCDKKGKPLYFAWFELVPFPSYTINAKVNAGDSMTGLVKILDSTHIQMQVSNATQGWTFTRSINWSLPDTSSAEWIVSAPAACVYNQCRATSLSNFGTAAMRNVSAVGNGNSGTLANPDWKLIPLQLVPGFLLTPNFEENAATLKQKADSPAGAIPGAVSDDGSNFTIKWVAVSTKGV